MLDGAIAIAHPRTEQSQNVECQDRVHPIAAKETLFKNLSARLMEAMGNGGPAAAIEVCSRDAPKIAARVGKAYGRKIGYSAFEQVLLESQERTFG